MVVAAAGVVGGGLANGSSPPLPSGGSVGVPEYLSTSAQTEGYHAGCPDGGKGLREACRSFTMVERVAL